jgi:hypothetical protein
MANPSSQLSSTNGAGTVECVLQLYIWRAGRGFESRRSRLSSAISERKRMDWARVNPGVSLCDTRF